MYPGESGAPPPEPEPDSTGSPPNRQYGCREELFRRCLTRSTFSPVSDPAYPAKDRSFVRQDYILVVRVDR
ncbi:hypothetical protein MSG28_016057 [Choristoneura fumiferana]|uniref:Uncharacterized protein n=1 Tax=Choristoneura fumiferana TaxID=7141 RepID=A0ACC0K5N5_CHOFU|nr:hypothetical protein MSG28_016057 [Choristoneura fumiferana]